MYSLYHSKVVRLNHNTGKYLNDSSGNKVQNDLVGSIKHFSNKVARATGIQKDLKQNDDELFF